MTSIWKRRPRQTRWSVYFAARILQHVRDNYLTHFTIGRCLLRAVLALWVYSQVSEYSQGGAEDPELRKNVTLGPSVTSDLSIADWIENGGSRVMLSGVGDLVSAQSRKKILDSGSGLLHNLDHWGLNRSYARLLLRLDRLKDT